HGDTMNTTARIQSKCNEYKAELLISDELRSKIDQNDSFTFQEVGSVPLKGKAETVDIVKVSKS
ncbi:MAG: adenylate/guanylate cyclase domain-containing protein, partial [Flavobacteriales bacterium]|nr:adenylate/guanylate cyclase domain-containing protein [Flavobacteriales bacterium]